jgi:hypothetical protein
MLAPVRQRGDSPPGVSRFLTGVDCESLFGSVHDVRTNALGDYFRCSRELADVGFAGEPSSTAGYFRCAGTTCYGRVAGIQPAKGPLEPLPAVSLETVSVNGRVDLPFDLDEVITNLQEERYAGQRSHPFLERLTASWASRALYYFLRPVLAVGIRRQLQKIRLTGWQRIAFPHWPVDTTVERLMRTTLATAARKRGIRKVPFIWFWPDGAEGCVLMTHDVEGPEGAAFCPELMDIDEQYGIKAAFQLVPEVRSGDTSRLREAIRNRGFEVNLHDLNHDGYLFDNREEFLRRAAQINQYAREYGCRGFRSGAMYREQRWFDAFDISYDMSVPNVAHLEPQRGGCCTVMPYFIGHVLELPATTVQDYSLFHILGDYSIRLWTEQCARILEQNGLVTFITHPDYLIERRARGVYKDLLIYLSDLRAERNIWFTIPGEADRWWRNRNQMRLVSHGSTWRIEGPESERARVAFAVVDDRTLVYEIPQSADGGREYAVQHE